MIDYDSRYNEVMGCIIAGVLLVIPCPPLGALLLLWAFKRALQAL